MNCGTPSVNHWATNTAHCATKFIPTGCMRRAHLSSSRERNLSDELHSFFGNFLRFNALHLTSSCFSGPLRRMRGALVVLFELKTLQLKQCLDTLAIEKVSFGILCLTSLWLVTSQHCNEIFAFQKDH